MEKNEKAEPPSTEGIKECPLVSLFPKTSENFWFWRNGFSKFANQLKVKIHCHLDECQLLWEKFSSNNSLFNLWEFRLAWYQGFGYPPFFYTLYLGKKPVAVLPLWFNKKKARYEWFGGTWPEDNHFFVTDEKFIPLLLKIVPRPAYLNAIVNDNLSEEVLKQLNDDSPKYILNLNGKKSIEEILLILEKKHRHHLRYYYKRFSDLNPKVEILLGDQSWRLPKLKELSIIDFERKNRSEYRKKERMITFENIYKNQGRYQILTFLVFIQNHLAVYDIAAVYKNTFYLLTGASDLARFPGISVFITYLEFEKALQMNVNLIDCMQEDYQWKHKYFFPQPMWKFELK
ncbi:MAG: hypothetical protein ACK4FL_03015 [Microgenomates group bacterium]